MEVFKGKFIKGWLYAAAAALLFSACGDETMELNSSTELAGLVEKQHYEDEEEQDLKQYLYLTIKNIVPPASSAFTFSFPFINWIDGRMDMYLNVELLDSAGRAFWQRRYPEKSELRVAVKEGQKIAINTSYQFDSAHMPGETLHARIRMWDKDLWYDDLIVDSEDFVRFDAMTEFERIERTYEGTGGGKINVIFERRP